MSGISEALGVMGAAALLVALCEALHTGLGWSAAATADVARLVAFAGLGTFAAWKEGV